MARACISGFNLAFLCLFMAVSLSAAAWPAKNKFHLYLPVIPIFIGALAVIALIFWIATSSKTTTAISKLKYYHLATIFAILLVIQLIVARALEATGYTWDNQIVFNAAAQFGMSGHLAVDAAKYFMIYPNNIPLLCGLGAFFRLLHQMGINDFLTAGVVLSAILLWATQVLIYLAARYLYGRRIAVLSLIFSFVLIDLSPQVATVYTDTLALIFPISILYLSLRFINATTTRAKVSLSAFIGVLSVVGALMKPTALISLVAILVTGVLWLIFMPRRSNGFRATLLARCVLVLSFTMVVTYFGVLGAEGALRILPFSVADANANSMPLAHFVAIGLETHHFNYGTEYGGYDPVEAAVIIKMPTERQKDSYSNASIRKSLSAYGPIGYINFIGHKANWIMSDATFYAYGEGSNDNLEFANNSPISTFVTNFAFAYGSYYELFANISQVFWLAILLLIGLQLVFVMLNQQARFNVYPTLLRIMLAGNIVFVLMFEGRSRYLFLYLPIFILLALYTVTVFEPEHS